MKNKRDINSYTFKDLKKLIPALPFFTKKEEKSFLKDIFSYHRYEPQGSAFPQNSVASHGIFTKQGLSP